MGLFKKLFHHCGEHLEYIECTRYPEIGTTGRGKVRRNYRRTTCSKLYTSCGNDIYPIKFPYALPIKKYI